MDSNCGGVTLSHGPKAVLAPPLDPGIMVSATTMNTSRKASTLIEAKHATDAAWTSTSADAKIPMRFLMLGPPSAGVRHDADPVTVTQSHGAIDRFQWPSVAVWEI
jgi:hypothetical protein